MTPDHRGPALRASWVLLTMGDRPDDLASAIASIAESAPGAFVTVVANGADIDPIPGAVVLPLAENVGVPGGRDAAMACSDADVVFFLDDDARVVGDWPERVIERFERDPKLAVVSMRLVDEAGATARRHVPRVARSGVGREGAVPTFLGGACAIRRSAYTDVGGYWAALWYGHEELDLSWRLIEAGYEIRYDPEAIVFHPRTDIGRHERGWWYTGRNRVWVARRDLPWPVAVLHTAAWLVAGLGRAPAGSCRRSYRAGWRAGWRRGPLPEADRRPISWRAVWALTRLGRPPVL